MLISRYVTYFTFTSLEADAVSMKTGLDKIYDNVLDITMNEKYKTIQLDVNYSF